MSDDTMIDPQVELPEEAVLSWTQVLEDETETEVEIELSAHEAVELTPDHGVLVQFIKELDAEMEDWDATLALCAHFAALQKQHDEEIADEARAAAEADLGGEG